MELSDPIAVDDNVITRGTERNKRKNPVNCNLPKFLTFFRVGLTEIIATSLSFFTLDILASL